MKTNQWRPRRPASSTYGLSLKEGQDKVYLTLQNPEEKSNTEGVGLGMRLPTPPSHLENLGAVQKQNKPFGLNPVTQKQTKRLSAGAPPGKTGQLVEDFWLPHLSSFCRAAAGLQVLTPSSLGFHNCSGTCFSSPINHYSLLREELGSYRNLRLAQLSNSKRGTKIPVGRGLTEI